MVVVVVDAVLSAHNPNGNAHATALYDQLRGSASYGGVAVGGAAGARSRTRAIYAVMSVLLTSGAGGPLPVPGRCSGGRVSGRHGRHGLTVRRLMINWLLLI
jgi:hypothetical protein